jgi:hypothetical protein
MVFGWPMKRHVPGAVSTSPPASILDTSATRNIQRPKLNEQVKATTESAMPTSRTPRTAPKSLGDPVTLGLDAKFLHDMVSTIQRSHKTLIPSLRALY